MAPFVSLLGMIVLLAIAWVASVNRRAISVRTVAGAFLTQLTLGALVLFVPAGQFVLEKLSVGVQQVINYANDGITFIFGGLVSDQMFTLFEGGTGFIFAFKVLPIIIFFSSLIAVLYHLRIMQFVIRVLGGGLQKALGTSRAESFSATANIFVGQTEAPLAVKPYIARMTRSELFAVMCGGLASIAGSVMAGYAQMGVDLKYLLAASFMAAPGGLLFAKILLPETDQPETNIDIADEETAVNLLDAAATGAASGLKLALNVGAMILAFVSLMALLNGLVGYLGGWFGHPELSLQSILGMLFAPLAWLLGIPWNEAGQGGSFIGQKIILNEMVAYADFVQIKDTLSPRTQAIITFALCGFANFASIAILLGGIGGIAPTRRSDIAQLGMKALLAATLSNLMSAAIAGLFTGL